MRLAYYPGCTLKTNAENFDSSTIATAEALGVELVEPARWNCCGTVHALAKDDVMHLLAPIRNLIRVEEMNDEGLVEEKKLITQCAMCYNTLKRADAAAQADSDKMQKIRDVMEKEPEFKGNVEVIHFLEALRERGWTEMSEKVTTDLNGLNVAPYYGCLLLRPREFSIDDPDNPRIMEDLLHALGADTVDIPFKAKCCGAYHIVNNKKVTAELSHRILEQAVAAGADMVATACPLCQYNIGDMQKEIVKIFRDFEPIPVVYYTQLMALALGREESAGFEDNYPDPRPILREKGLI
ncbi:MAG: CoB--CoM heterodisulfide reductase iron-sulfur subunit B family protein [Candidatus Bathyarchaeota archaeon]|nr:MAG: CoB--CoM heterodisulfide reductase iron-sulfur subunit B family protein [Candidatus Bathyarchaeota archaeon]